MAHIKTAISVDEVLFQDVVEAAESMHTSRSQLIETALREWLKKEKRKLLMAQINIAVQGDSFSEEDKRQAEFMKKRQQKLVKGEW